MAKKNGNGNGATVTESETTETVVVENTDKPLDKTAIKALFVEYEEKDDLIEQAKAAVEKAVQARSDVVKKIAAASGGKKKLRYKGQEVTIVSKANKTTNTETFFFRGKTRDEDALDIDAN